MTTIPKRTEAGDRCSPPKIGRDVREWQKREKRTPVTIKPYPDLEK